MTKQTTIGILLIFASVSLLAYDTVRPRTVSVPVPVEISVPAESLRAAQITQAHAARVAEMARAHRASMLASLAPGEQTTDIGGEIVQPGTSSTRGVTLPPGSRTLRIVNPASGFAIGAIADSAADGGVWSQYTTTNTGSAAARFSADVVFTIDANGSGSEN